MFQICPRYSKIVQAYFQVGIDSGEAAQAERTPIQTACLLPVLHEGRWNKGVAGISGFATISSLHRLVRAGHLFSMVRTGQSRPIALDSLCASLSMVGTF